MKKIALIFAGILATMPTFAEEGKEQDLTKIIPAVSYVKTAYNTLDTSKQEKLNSTGNGANVSDSGTGPYVGGVAATNGRVTITKTEVSIPVGSATTPTGRADIWVE